MGILQHHHRWSTDQEILPEFPPESDSSSSENSLASVTSLTTSKQPSTTQKHHYLTTFKAHTSSITSLTLAGKHLLSGSSDNQVRVWPRDALPTVQNLMAYGESTVKSMVVCGDKLFTGHQDHKIRVWKIEHDDDEVNKRKTVTSTYLATLPTINDRVTKMFLAKNYIKIPRNKKCTWVNHIDAVAALALSHDGSLLYSASWDRTFKVWRTSDFKCLESVSDAHDDAINAIVVSHDGYIYTGSADRKIKVWRKYPGEKKHTLVDTLEKHKSAVNALALSPDGSVLYSGACDRSILVWEKGNGGESGGDWRHMVVAGALRGHGMAVLCIVVVGDLVISGSADKTVRIWRGIGGKKYSRVCVLEGHNGPIKCLAATVDSCISAESSGTSYLVYSGSLDCDVKAWKIWLPFL
ncbi:putative transcription factor WD40-like family [Helianthus annuus]|uniref:Transcription factor WD40-like family n=1 Tax=Helianthus annuus TaxID=4232 RepID=A0A9K3E117_HELAN|nr:protein JINGUBANG [Helianthus annuus]KAF5764282.1 putative transcription factor WD40-like family [Helianthus annuus]KAJ0450984.1 putative transcription factor WD40-like family [Helianthus annuus]KAJ0455344.1 putative transcription factor WD40-like family [Helianthus annuus]KAJ0472843.1 putative transcription factor WD40-like family [Helianthus annuus]KAJ0648451.1 putative transcription factor WD40-like family [Helianthus annuus]